MTAHILSGLRRISQHLSAQQRSDIRQLIQFWIKHPRYSPAVFIWHLDTQQLNFLMDVIGSSDGYMNRTKEQILDMCRLNTVSVILYSKKSDEYEIIPVLIQS